MYKQNLIPLSTYQNICDRYDACIRHAQEDLAALESKPRFYDLKKIEESLNWEELFPDGYVSREFFGSLCVTDFLRLMRNGLSGS